MASLRHFTLAALVMFASDAGARAMGAASAPIPREATETLAEVPPFVPPAPRDERALRRVMLKQQQVTSAIVQLAKRLLDRPMGSETIRVVGGKRLSFLVEPHYHAPGSGHTPEGWHKGVTVYALEEADALE
jgi:hypothetical protein